MEFGVSSLPDVIDENGFVSKYWRNIQEKYNAWMPSDVDGSEKPLLLLSYLARNEIEQLGQCFDPNVLNFAAVCLEVFQVVEIICIPKILLMYERTKFFSLAQDVDESFNAFFGRLTSQANVCEFGDSKEEVLVEKVISGIRDEAIRERLRFSDHLNLSKVLHLFASLEGKGKGVETGQEIDSKEDIRIEFYESAPPVLEDFKVQVKTEEGLLMKKAPADGLKKKRGRPRIHPIVPKIKKKRGRPKKIEEVKEDEKPQRERRTIKKPKKFAGFHIGGLVSRHSNKEKVKSSEKKVTEIKQEKEDKTESDLPKEIPADKEVANEASTVEEKSMTNEREGEVADASILNPPVVLAGENEPGTSSDAAATSSNLAGTSSDLAGTSGDLAGISGDLAGTSGDLLYEIKVEGAFQMEKKKRGRPKKSDVQRIQEGKRARVQGEIVAEGIPGGAVDNVLIDEILGGLNLNTASSYEINVEGESKKLQFRCPECGKLFGKDVFLQRHIDRMHNSNTFKCVHCNASMESIIMMKVHLKRHMVCIPCPHCDQFFRAKELLKNHIDTKHGGKVHQCHLCGATTKTINGLKFHYKLHAGEKPYICDVCGRAFAMLTNLKEHRRSKHTGEKPFACTLCPYRTGHGSSLKLHMRTHTKECPYVCSVCGRRFKCSSHQVRHEATHTNDAPYRCDLCGNQYRQAWSLKCHRRTHHPHLQAYGQEEGRRGRHPQVLEVTIPADQIEGYEAGDQTTYEILVEDEDKTEIVLDSETIAAAEALVSNDFRRPVQYYIDSSSPTSRVLTLNENLVHQSQSGVFSVVKIMPDGTIMTSLEG